jgi:hypothetical protein
MTLTAEQLNRLSPETESRLHGVKDGEVRLVAGDLYHLDSSLQVHDGPDVLAHVILDKNYDPNTDTSENIDELAIIDMRSAKRDSQGAKLFNDQLIDHTIEYLVIDPKQLDWETGKGFKGLRKGEAFTFGRPVEGQTPADDPRWRFDKTSRRTSRNHVSFKVDALGEIYVQDEESANGTFVATGTAAHERMAPDSTTVDKTVPRITDMPRKTAENLQRTQQAEGIVLDEKSIAHFIEMAQHTDQPELTKELTGVDALAPKTGLMIDNKEFYFTRTFTTGNRKHIIAYVKEADSNKLSPRLFYKSFSDGGWRSTPYIHRGGVYSKGKESKAGGYVQETKPVASVGRMLEAIDQHPPVTNTDHQNLSSLFSKERQSRDGVLDYDEQVTSTKLDEQWASELYANYEPGIGYIKEAKEAREGLENMHLPEGFEPDFNTKPKNVYTVNHSIAGPVTISVYNAEYSGQNMEWHVAEDTEGNVWLDKVAPENSGTTTYGTSTHILRLGALSAKPFEYASQVKGMEWGIDYDAVPGSSYVDLRKKYWGEMPWVQHYKQATQ